MDGLTEYKERLKNYSSAELEDVKKRIDRENNPERFTAILEEIERRKNAPVVEEITDTNIPELYSRRAIYTFSVLFSVLFGGVLFALNLKSIKSPLSKSFLWIYIIAYSFFTLLIISYFPDNRGPGLLLNAVGGIPLYSYFWKLYISADLKYRKKSFIMPLIIGVILNIVLLFLIYSYD